LATLQDFELLLGIGTAAEKGVYRAGFGKSVMISPPAGNILSLRGVLADSVLVTRIDAGPDHRTKFEDFQVFFQILAKCLPYPTGEELEDVRMRTLIGDHPWEGDGSPKTCFAALQAFLSTTDEAERDKYISTARPYLVAHFAMMKGRKCCLTDNRYVGVVPINTQRGDEVFVPPTVAPYRLLSERLMRGKETSS